MLINGHYRDENLEKVELSELTVNPGQPKAGPQDFELLKLLGKGGYGKVATSVNSMSSICCNISNMNYIIILINGCSHLADVSSAAIDIL